MQDIRYRNKIVYLSFILAVLIVLRHSCGIGKYETLNGGLLYVETFLSYFTDLVVPTFFAISGFLFYQNFEWRKLRTKWESRFHSLVIPFVLWNIIGFCFAWLLFHIPAVSSSMSRVMPDYSVYTWLIDVFIDTRYNITWFIRDLIVFVVFTPFLYPILTKRVGGAFLIFVVLIICLIVSNKLITPYSAVFMFGGYMGIHYKDICQHRYGKKNRVTCFSVLVVMVIIESIIGSPQHDLMTPLRILQIPVIWVAADVLAIDSAPKWWIKISFFVYCSHSLILESVEKLFWIVLGDTEIGALLDFIFAPFITLIIIVSVAWALRKSPGLWAILNGGRGA